jgi:hypothetical protein
VKTKPINTVDIYQLMCHVLRITPSANDGIWSHVDDILADTSSRTLCTIPELIAHCSLYIFVSFGKKKERKNMNINEHERESSFRLVHKL